MGTPAKFPSQVAQRIMDILTANKAALVAAGHLADDANSIMYGDQDKLPVTPMLCIESGTTTRELDGVPQRVLCRHEVHLIYYHSRVQEVQLLRLEAEEGAEAIVTVLDSNLTLELESDGGIVIHGFVTNIDPGYIRKGERTLVRSVRLTWQGKTKTMLGV